MPDGLLVEFLFEGPTGIDVALDDPEDPFADYLLRPGGPAR
jgi:hypothetical protein